jgi:hypothetical protein
MKYSAAGGGIKFFKIPILFILRSKMNKIGILKRYSLAAPAAQCFTRQSRFSSSLGYGIMEYITSFNKNTPSRGVKAYFNTNLTKKGIQVYKEKRTTIPPEASVLGKPAEVLGSL